MKLGYLLFVAILRLLLAGHFARLIKQSAGGLQLVSGLVGLVPCKKIDSGIRKVQLGFNQVGLERTLGPVSRPSGREVLDVSFGKRLRMLPQTTDARPDVHATVQVLLQISGLRKNLPGGIPGRLVIGVTCNFQVSDCALEIGFGQIRIHSLEIQNRLPQQGLGRKQRLLDGGRQKHHIVFGGLQRIGPASSGFPCPGPSSPWRPADGVGPSGKFISVYWQRGCRGFQGFRRPSRCSPYLSCSFAWSRCFFAASTGRVSTSSSIEG